MATTTMTAAVLSGHGGPESLQVRTGMPLPRLGHGQVLVQVTAAGINNTDIWSREGAYGTGDDPGAIAGWRGVPLDVPRIQGGDVVGRIVGAGEDVDDARMGERVLVDPALYDRETEDATAVGLLGSERDGGFATFAAVDAARAHAVDDSPLSDEQLACLPIAYGTAMGMLERGDVAAGERVLVTGASGGVGLALVELAAARGGEVVALTTGDKQQAVRDAGATRTVDRTAENMAAAIHEAAEAELDVVADVVGGEVFTAAFPLLREGGRLVSAGAVAGPLVEFDLRVLYLHQRRLIGSSLHTPEQFAHLVDLARHGMVSPRIDATYPLERIHEAQRDFVQRPHVGKLVVLP